MNLSPLKTKEITKEQTDTVFRQISLVDLGAKIRQRHVLRLWGVHFFLYFLSYYLRLTVQSWVYTAVGPYLVLYDYPLPCKPRKSCKSTLPTSTCPSYQV